MYFKYLLVICMMICTTHVHAQTTPMLRGKITTPDGSAVVGATVLWKGTQLGTKTDTSGRFLIKRLDTTAYLLIRFIGVDDIATEILPTDQDVWIEVKDLPEQVLREVVVREKQFGNSVSLLGSTNIERITSDELRKAPCCNLSESFETNNTVDVAYPNAITGVREVQLLGLRSTYSAFMVENRQSMKGIAAPYAFEYYPGTWLRGIQISKGASTVVNGSEGISGQINVELQRPDLDHTWFVNAYTNTGNRTEANIHLNQKGTKGISHGVLMHGSLQRSPFDHNRDNFYDMLNREQLNGMYRMVFDSESWCGQVTAHTLTDTRNGGQIASDASGGRFGYHMRNQRAEITAKLGRTNFLGKPYRELGNILNGSIHETQGTVGRNRYSARQESFFVQSVYKTIFNSTDHQIRFGPTLSADIVRERLNESVLDRKEVVLSGIAEYTYLRPNLTTGSSDFSLVTGIRSDWNSLFGLLISPRMAIKYNPTERNTFRISAGRGYHSPYIIPENLSWLATNKTLQLTQVTHAESAWNYGLNYVHKWQWRDRPINLTFDAYRTDFERQLLIDQETRPDTLSIYYTTAPSWAQTAMLMFQIQPIKGLEVKLAAKWQDVQATYRDGVRRWMPLLPRVRGLVSTEYTTPNQRWAFTATMHLVGTQRLPDNSTTPSLLTRDFPERTPVYPVFQAQITRRWKQVEVYVGGENLTSYTQHTQIISAQDPTSKYFNASQIWAPAFGRMGFIGIRAFARDPRNAHE